MFTETQVSMNGVGTITESLDLSDTFVNPLDDYLDPVTGEWWLPIWGRNGGYMGIHPNNRAGFLNEEELWSAINTCRVLAERNEYVISGIENRTNYIIGDEHIYTIVARKGFEPGKDALARAQDYLDEWVYDNAWGERQQETVRRRDRDGEAILRYFENKDTIRVRFVEPFQIKNPQGKEELKRDGTLAFGIETDPDDVETVVKYYIDDEPVDHEEIQHRKANVDRNVRRGMPTFWPVRRILYKIDEVTEFLAALAKSRAAYAVHRKVKGLTSGGASSFVEGLSLYANTNATTGERRRWEKKRPGQVVTTNENTEIIFPASNIGAMDYEITVKLLLRAVASRLVMPVWMLSADPSEMAAYTAAVVGESPSVRNFQRLQGAQKRDDLRLLWRVIQKGIDVGKIPPEVWDQCEIDIEAPDVQVRDALKDAQVRQANMATQILSPQTASAEAGYEYEQEQTNIEDHAQQHGGGLASPVDLLGMGQPTTEGEQSRPFAEDCGTGAGGFKSGNKCAGEGGGGTATLSPSGIEEVEVGRKTVKTFRNPAKSAIKRMIGKGQVRGLISPDEGDVVLWPAAEATHDQMADALGFKVGKKAPRFYFGELDDPDEVVGKLKKYQAKAIKGGAAAFEGLVIPRSDIWIMEGMDAS